VEVANLGEDAGVGRGVGTRSAADGRLVDLDDLVNVLHADDGLVLAGIFARVVEVAGQGAVEDVVDQGGFSRTGNSGDQGHDAQGEAGVEILKIIFARAEHGDGLVIGLAAVRQHGNVLLAGDVLASKRFGRAHDVRGRA